MEIRAHLVEFHSHNFIEDEIEKRKPFKCDVCEKRFADLGHLKRHSNIHFGWFYWYFFKLWCLKQISFIADDDPRKQKYECDICGKKLNDKGHMKKHKKLHKQVQNSKSESEFQLRNNTNLSFKVLKSYNCLRVKLVEKSFQICAILTDIRLFIWVSSTVYSII